MSWMETFFLRKQNSEWIYIYEKAYIDIRSSVLIGEVVNVDIETSTFF